DVTHRICPGATRVGAVPVRVVAASRSRWSRRSRRDPLTDVKDEPKNSSHLLDGQGLGDLSDSIRSVRFLVEFSPTVLTGKARHRFHVPVWAWNVPCVDPEGSGWSAEAAPQASRRRGESTRCRAVASVACRLFALDTALSNRDPVSAGRATDGDGEV